MLSFRSERNNRLRSTVQSRDRFLSLRLFLFARAVSKLSTGPRSPCSKHCAATEFQSKQSPRSLPQPASRKLLLRNVRRFLWATLNLESGLNPVATAPGTDCSLLTANCSLVLRHYFFATLEEFAHFTLGRRRQNLQSVRSSLLQLFLLHVGKFGQMIFRPTVFDKLQRIILAQRMSFPIGRQKYSSQIRMVAECHPE